MDKRWNVSSRHALWQAVVLGLSVLLVLPTAVSGAGARLVPSAGAPTAQSAPPKPAGANGHSAGGFQSSPGRPAGHGRPAVGAANPAPPFLTTAKGRLDKARANRGQFDPGALPLVEPNGRVITSTSAGSSSGTAADPVPNAPSLGGTFVADTKLASIPPDVTFAVGPHDMVTMTNDTVTVFKKNGQKVGTPSPLATNPVGLSAFFGTTDSTFDPRAIYDEYTNHYFLLTATVNPTGGAAGDGHRSAIVIAVSNDDNATSGWTLHTLDMTRDGNDTSGNWCDFPQIGYDAGQIYLSCNMFEFGGGFQYAKVRVLTKSELTTGACCGYWDTWGMFDVTNHSFTVAPAHMYGASATEPEVLINAHGGGGSDDDVSLWQIHNASSCCNGGSPSIEGENYAVGDFATPDDVPQLGSSTKIESGDTRLLYAYWRNGHLSTGHTTGCNSGDVCSNYTEIDLSGGLNRATTVQDFAVGNPGSFYWFPAVAVNGAGDRTMIYSRSSGSQYAGAYFLGIPANAPHCDQGDCPASPLDGPETVLKAGLAPYVSVDSKGKNRWGDYQGAATDPDGIGIWIDGEFVPSTNNWATAVGLTREPLDGTAPSSSAAIVPAPTGFGWNNQVGVLVNVTATDGGSGVRFITTSATGAQTIAPLQVTINPSHVAVQNEGITTVSFFAEDNWGNIESPAKTIQVKIDRTSPTATCDTPDGLWHNADIDILCYGADSLSGLADGSDSLFFLSTSVPAGTETATAFTSSHQVCDQAANCITAGPIGPIMVDRKPPAIAITTPSATPTYYLHQSVPSSYGCTDGGSGVATCAGPVANGAPLDTSSVGTKTFTVNATDNVGNASFATETYKVTYKICLQYDPAKALPKGSVLAIRLALCDANNVNVSDPSVIVTATGVTPPGTLQNPGNVNPGGVFQFLNTGGYLYTLGTKGDPAGTYALLFTATGDPIVHQAPFKLK